MDTIAKTKLIIFPVCLLPLFFLIQEGLNNDLGPDPGRELTLELGEWALRFLLITLALSPIKKLTSKGKVIRYRRMLGLFALFYAAVHLVSYLGFMLAWDWGELLNDLYKRSYIIVGAMALSIMIALGVTSPKVMMRKMGRSWKKLHKLVYVAAILAIVHYLWLVKSDYSEPLIYGGILVLLMIARLPVKKILPRKS